MNRHVAFFMAAVGFGLLLSGTPVAAQNQGNGKGQGPFGVNVCAATVDCPSGSPDAFDACVSFANVCSNFLKAGTNPALFQTCCEKCLVFDAVCGIPAFTDCAGDFTPALDCRP